MVSLWRDLHFNDRAGGRLGYVGRSPRRKDIELPEHLGLAQGSELTIRNASRLAQPFVLRPGGRFAPKPLGTSRQGVFFSQAAQWLDHT